ncbi:TrmB family transcriptional regulator [Colwellia psychrerythraea]|uniref:Transcriptional regulator, TrmB family n=1 Tax=Colwellia psychrerythraea TaxID=28229 RepID=A0A099KQ32_COLPS|nr:helix-turn-helix domain-containing protein [Colwellia psychrerythraea]KGJ91743.1 transcriptional regulator, TrmB family [Colwellia psychrerythraea]
MSKNQQSQQQVLTSQLCLLGFTQLESEVYLHLLINGDNTGYAVAKGIGKAVANVYKAVEGLSNKGAVEITVGDSKICHAAPWQQVLKSAQSRFSENISELEQQLKQLPAQQDDENVYQLKNTEQVLTTAKLIIAQASSIIVAELKPETAEYFAPFLEQAAARGVEVRIKVYQAITIKGAQITLRQNGKQVYAKTNHSSFKLCADGEDSLTAILTADLLEVIQAFKSKSALICMEMYCGLIYELILTDLKQAIPAGDIKLCQQILDETEHLHPFSTENNVFTNFKSRYQQ